MANVVSRGKSSKGAKKPLQPKIYTNSTLLVFILYIKHNVQTHPGQKQSNSEPLPGVEALLSHDSSLHQSVTNKLSFQLIW